MADNTSSGRDRREEQATLSQELQERRSAVESSSVAAKPQSPFSEALANPSKPSTVRHGVVCVPVELTVREAWEFAQFLKRVGYGNYKALCEPYNDDGPHHMITAGEKIRTALAAQGYSPR